MAPAHLVLLLPHCLQAGDCGRDVVGSVAACARCGRCDLAALIALAEGMGVRCCIAAGGRLALAEVRRRDVRAVVAVACEQELWDGIRAAFPKPVLAVPNRRPHGPCRDTRADLDAVSAALAALLATPA